MNAWKASTINMLRRILPARVRNSLFNVSYHIANHQFRRFAYEYGNAPAMDFGLERMSLRGFAPATIVDVGAFEGDWSSLARRLWPQCRLVMIEPNVANLDRLRTMAARLDASLLPDLLGASDGATVAFNVMGSGSSVMNERSPLRRRVEQRTTKRLDSVLSSIEAPAFLKIDAQGYELEILRGATSLMPSLEAILLEIAFIEINEGAPLLHDVTAFMKAQSFVAYDILEIHRRPLDKALNQVDIMFVREGSALLADKRHFG